MIHVRVDGDKCQGHNRCMQVADELFDVDDYGYAHELNDGALSPELEAKARLAIRNCPERAITLAKEDD